MHLSSFICSSLLARARLKGRARVHRCLSKAREGMTVFAVSSLSACVVRLSLRSGTDRTSDSDTCCSLRRGLLLPAAARRSVQRRVASLSYCLSLRYFFPPFHSFRFSTTVILLLTHMHAARGKSGRFATNKLGKLLSRVKPASSQPCFKWTLMVLFRLPRIIPGPFELT